MLIDSHCHLDFPDFAHELDEVVARAGAAGVARMITISTRVDKFETYRTIAERFDDVFFSVGTHPNHAHEEPEAGITQIVALSAHPKCVAIGEAGLDYHYDRVPRDLAHRVFRTHIAAARETGLPLVIHSRDADDDMAAVLREEMGKGIFRAVLHCFTASEALAMTGIELGLYVSFSGVITFAKPAQTAKVSSQALAMGAQTNAKGSQTPVKVSETAAKTAQLIATARKLPANRLLIETDAPYLAPAPHRGRRNEPAFVAATAASLAALRGVTLEEIAAMTTANVLTLFNKMPPLSKALA